MQASSTADYIFKLVRAFYAGSNHDSTLFKGSNLHMLMNDNKFPWLHIIFCDDAYTHEYYLLCPCSESKLS